MGVIPIIRQGVLGLTSLFSLVVLAISAHLISQTQQYFGVTAIFCALAVAVAAISLVTLPVMLVVDIFRRGAFTSMIVVELSWLSVLWILWVAAAGETVTGYNASFPDGCIYLNSIVNGMCQQSQAIEALSFLNFILLMLYTGLLGVMAAIAVSRGQNVWLSSVRDALDSPASQTQHPMTQYGASAPPQHQPQAYPAGVQYAVEPEPAQGGPTPGAITV